MAEVLAGNGGVMDDAEEILRAMDRVRAQHPVIERLADGSYRRVALPFQTMTEYCAELRDEILKGQEQ